MVSSLSDSGASAPFGVYIHVPFCSRRCDYCAFATWTDRHHLIESYLRACESEARRFFAETDRQVTSVFVGGGTPSLVPASLLARVFSAVPMAPGAEVTIECNPDNVTGELLEHYRAAGVTRVSLGVQSMVPSVLEALGRTHVPENVVHAVRLLGEAGIGTFNLDLIYGARGETADEWRQTVESALELEPTHVSAYALTVEAGTPLAADRSRYPDDDDQAEKYDVVDDLLTAAGRMSYEISNWALPTHECRHNLLYWSQGDYIGIGCAAHSHRQGRRWWNVRTPDRYVALIEAGLSAEGGHEVLDEDTMRRERLQLALRTRDGVPVDSFSDRDRAELEELGLVQLGLDRLSGLAGSGVLAGPGVLAGSGVLAGPGVLPEPDVLPGPDVLPTQGPRLVLTRKGRMLANEVALRLR